MKFFEPVGKFWEHHKPSNPISGIIALSCLWLAGNSAFQLSAHALTKPQRPAFEQSYEAVQCGALASVEYER